MGSTEIDCGVHKVHFGENVLEILASHLTVASPPVSRVVILCDTNTHEHCLPFLLEHLAEPEDALLLEITPGEESKNLGTAEHIWESMAQAEIDRNAVLINLGGGVVSDLGGFCAATYKRGIRYVNVATSLLAMVDASIGGKTGVDLGVRKNMVGLFAPPKKVYIQPQFIRTLPKRHMMNGLAEMMKHALIMDADHWKGLIHAPLHDLDAFSAMILHSAGLKSLVVLKDPNEHGLRKTLNFGHTIGHAIESFSLENQGTKLLHGEAIAVGMICEGHISLKRGCIDSPDFDNIQSILKASFPSFGMKEEDHIRIVELMKNDKKNTSGSFNFTLLEGIGKASFNQEVSVDEIRNALDYYRMTCA